MARVLLLAASIAWLGGLFRLAGEALAAFVSRAGPRLGEAFPLLVFGLVILAVEAVLLWRWPWFRRFRRQTNDDFRVFYGLPAEPARQAEPSRRPAAISVGLIVIAGLVTAALLPGAGAAAIGLLLGVVLRLGTLLMATR